MWDPSLHVWKEMRNSLAPLAQLCRATYVQVLVRLLPPELIGVVEALLVQLLCASSVKQKVYNVRKGFYFLRAGFIQYTTQQPLKHDAGSARH